MTMKKEYVSPQTQTIICDCVSAINLINGSYTSVYPDGDGIDARDAYIKEMGDLIDDMDKDLW